MNDEHTKAITQAKANLEDVAERGAEALVPWSEIRDKYFTPEEIVASELRAELMHELVTARHDTSTQ